MAVENTAVETACTEVWFNELRFSNIDEEGGYAALARIDMKLADLGTITLAELSKPGASVHWNKE